MSTRYAVIRWPAMGPWPESYHVWDNETHGEVLGRYTAEGAAERVAELNAPVQANKSRPSPMCGETTVFWPEAEHCDAECMRPVGHDGPHEDGTLGKWE